MGEFVEVKTADLVGAALDWAVAVAVGESNPQPGLGGKGCVVAHGHTLHRFAPSTEWSHGGPLIEKYDIAPVKCGPHGDWIAGEEEVDGPTALIALCRAVALANIGPVVSIPRELLP